MKAASLRDGRSSARTGQSAHLSGHQKAAAPSSANLLAQRETGCPFTIKAQAATALVLRGSELDGRMMQGNLSIGWASLSSGKKG
jgi:hypothetical protein